MLTRIDFSGYLSYSMPFYSDKRTTSALNIFIRQNLHWCYLVLFLNEICLKN